MYEIQFDYAKRKYGKTANLCYTDTGSVTVYIKSVDIYKDNAEDIEIRFAFSNYEFDRPLPKIKK